MQIEDFLSPSEITIDMRTPDKVRLLTNLARQAAAKLNLPSDAVAMGWPRAACRNDIGVIGAPTDGGWN
jgi:hypothetical protein